MTTLLEIADATLAHTRGDVQVTVTHERSLTSRFARSRATQATAIDDVAVQVLCVRDGHTATASTRGSGDAVLRDVAGRAQAGAEAAAGGGSGDYPGLAEPSSRAHAHEGWDAATAELDPALASAALTAIFDEAGRDGMQVFGVWTAGAVETAIASSTGVRATDRVSDAYLKVIARDGNGRSGFAARAAVAAGALDARQTAREAAAKVVRAEPAELEPGDYPAVIDANGVAELLEFLGLLAFNGLAHGEGRGALTGRLGERVAAPAINIADSPRFPGTLPRAFDAEGVPKAPLPLIQDGVAHRVVHDLRSAALAGDGARSTGHALEAGGSSFGPVPTNLVLAGGGATDVAELAAPIERGIYVTRFWYVNTVHPKQTLLTGMTRDGTFLIENGQIARPLRDVRFTDSILGLLSRTEALTSGQSLVNPGHFYGPRLAWGTVCPAIRVSALRITGSTV